MLRALLVRLGVLHPEFSPLNAAYVFADAYIRGTLPPALVMLLGLLLVPPVRSMTGETVVLFVLLWALVTALTTVYRSPDVRLGRYDSKAQS